MEKVKNYFRGLINTVRKTKKDYEEDYKKLSAEEKEKEDGKRMEAYKALCLGGVTSLYWKDTTALLNKVRAISKLFASGLSEWFAICQALMLIGLAASSFPKSSPWSLVAASNGSLFSVLYNIAAFHLEIIEFLPHIFLLISWILVSLAFTVYWSVGSQDLTIVKPIYNLLYMILSNVIKWIVFLFRLFIIVPFKYFAKCVEAGVFNHGGALGFLILGPPVRIFGEDNV